MKELRIFGICICVLLGTVMGNAASKLPSSVTMSKVQLENKIKGGWAGQTIGVSFGSYTEFRYQGTSGLSDDSLGGRLCAKIDGFLA